MNATTAPPQPPRLVFGSLVGYQRRWLRGDVLAGLTVWAVLIPESLAYATIAGVPAVVGLYAAVPALVLYAVLGSSRHLIVSPMSATAALSAGVVATFTDSAALYIAMTTGLALAVGVAAIAAGLLRLGFLASLISEPVLKGFIIGLALTILVGQLPKLFGVEKGEGNFFEKLWDLLTHLGDTQGLSLAVGLGSLALLLALRRWLPLLPGSLIVVAASIAVVSLFSLDSHGLEIVGHIEAGLPSIGFPDLSVDQLLDLAGPAIGVMLVGFAEGLGAARTYAAREGYDVDSNHELLGLGVANLGSGLCSGMVVNGSLSKTAVNGSAGAKSQFSGLTAAVLTIVTLLFLTGLFEELPEATLAAVVIVAVIELIDVASLERLWRVQTGALAAIYRFASRADFIAAVATLLGVLLFDTLPGLVIGIAISLVLLLARTSRPHVASLAPLPGPEAMWADVARHPDLSGSPQALVLRVEGALFFGNADYVRDEVRRIYDTAPDPRPHLVVLDGATVPSIDVTAAAMLVQLRKDLAKQGAELSLSGGIGQVRDILDTAEAADEPPVYPSIEDAIGAARSPDSGEDPGTHGDEAGQ